MNSFSKRKKEKKSKWICNVGITNQKRETFKSRKTIPYHTGWYGRNLLYQYLCRYRNKVVSFRKIYRPYWVVLAVLATYIGFWPVISYRTGKRKVFLSHSHLPPVTISTFSTSSRGHGLILVAATSSLSLSVFQTSQMIFSTPKK